MTRATPPQLYECARCKDVYRWDRTRLVYVPPRARPAREPTRDSSFVCERCERDGVRP